MSYLKAAGICLALACALTFSAVADTVTVTNTNDSGPGSLRQALVIAHDGDTIDATGISGVISLTGGELLVDKSVTINGAGADLLAVDGNMASRGFRIVFSGKTVTISGFTIRNGHGGSIAGGGVDNENDSTVTIANCTIIGNSGVEFGGGIFNSGMMTIANTTLSGNLSSEGGALYNNSSGTLTITNSTISGNTAGDNGGACFNIGAVTITNSTLSGNSAGFTGGILNTTDATVQIGDTILNADVGSNISNFGTVISHGYNLSSDDGAGVLTGPGDQINTNPLLGPLQANGGPTFTHALLPGSPAINAGNPNFTPPPLFDQRGPSFDRVINGRIDIGSFEVQGTTTTPTPSPTPMPTATQTPTPMPTATPIITPSSTATPQPTATPAATPIPTSTPRPSPTPRVSPTPRARFTPHRRPTPHEP